jgi:membrane protein
MTRRFRLRGFGGLARSVAVSFWRRDALVDASAMAFSLFLASIPLLALAGLALGRLLAGEPRALAFLGSLGNIAPDEVRALLDRALLRGMDASTAPLFLVGSWWLAATAFQDAMNVFELALGTERRPWILKRLFALAFVVALLGFLCGFGAVAVVLAGGPFALLRSLVERADPAVDAFLLSIAVATPPVAAFFRFGVRHGKARPRVWPGAAATVSIGTLASYGFARYAKSLATYAVFYGSLAAVAVFLVWLWICCIALLVGIEVNAELETGRGR